MNIDHYTYRVTWSAEDGEHVGLCAEFPSLSWLAKTPEAALKGIHLSATQLYRTLSPDGNPVLSSLSAILKAMGLRPRNPYGLRTRMPDASKILAYNMSYRRLTAD